MPDLELPTFLVRLGRRLLAPRMHTDGYRLILVASTA
jgi:hypothetical protein